MLNNNMNAAGRLQDKDSLARIILENGVNHVVHLATLLSGALEDLQATLHVQAFHTAQACLQWAQEGPWLCMFCYSKMPVLSNRGHSHELTGFLPGAAIGERNPQLALRVNTSGIQVIITSSVQSCAL